ncbi:unnamed protein product [Caenorhabditis angaria]|uniref:Alpha-mannosidase n=1 Tax=Caenorhabditis angaria TaxID=860376 RepID=A0A9P1N832_9PELO|nr:unnamed protein product [Caenorhabditis angaria]
MTIPIFSRVHGMIRRNGYLLICLAAFLIFSLYLYNGIDTGNDIVVRRQEYIEQLKKKVEKLEDIANNNEKQIDQLETDIKTVKIERERELKSQSAVEKVEDKAAEVDVADEVVVRGDRLAHINQIHQRTTPSLKNTCGLRANLSKPDSSLQMLDLYDVWKFDNPDGGVWKQGFPITYDEEAVKKEDRLEIVIIPHSHCDPGWIQTFEGYYEKQTKFILDGMAKHLEIKDGLKFIYAEMSFFEMWWKEQNEATREKVKKYLEDGKFEIVTGGWVMSDEANAHYHSMIVELFEGHEWIKNHLGKAAIPKSHWSIDPFGLSPSMPHLLTSSNITNAVIQRVHYSVKRELALKKNLEFYWRQLSGKSSQREDLRTHIMPFYSYDVPHTCGPEPSICCQFDFRRLPKGGKSCDWGIPPREIDSNNVAERAKMLYDQYRKKAQLYKNNVIFAPLGDDFRYDIDFEWDSQYSNYKQLFEYMNSQKDWNVHAQFGTLKDYFEKLDKRLIENGKKLETLSGDFFTYADRDDHYWSGYFTSRPFYKQLDRVLQHYLRSAEIAFSLANIEEGGMMEKPIFEKLQRARRALALFQHHDGVTGTAKDHVVLDYGRKMIDALNDCEDVLSESFIVLLGIDNTNKMIVDETRVNENVLPEKRVYTIGQNVVIFNTLSRQRSEPICIHVDSLDAGIEADQDIANQQIAPVIQFDENVPNLLKIKKDTFELCFSAKLGPMSTVAYRIVKSTNTKKAKISTNFEISIDNFDRRKISGEFNLDNGKINVVFDENSGMAKSITHQIDKKTINLNSQFIHYGARKNRKHFSNGNEDNPAGAYLFLPNGEAKIIEQQQSKYVVIDGNVVKKVLNIPNSELKVLQTFSIYDKLDYLDLDQEIDIRARDDFEFALRFSSNIESGDTFYTDLNGLQMIKRKRRSKLPLQANYYPMSAGVFIEDDSSRLSIHSAQALGVSSLKSGEIEIMLDRRLNSDDNRGLQQGVKDNKRTIGHFRILSEPMSSSTSTEKEKERVGYHSSVSQFATWSLHYPIVKMISDGTPKPVVSKNFDEELNCDLHVVTFRSLAGKTSYEKQDEQSTAAEKKSALIVHRIVPDCRSRITLEDQGCQSRDHSISPLEIVPTLKSAKQTSLTNLYENSDSSKTKFEIQPNEVSNILVAW